MVLWHGIWFKKKSAIEKYFRQPENMTIVFQAGFIILSFGYFLAIDCLIAFI